MTALDSPGMQHARNMLALALEHEAQAGRVHDAMPAVPNARQAVSIFVAATHEFASVILRSPRDYPARAVDFATGILSEAIAFVQADSPQSRTKHLRST